MCRSLADLGYHIIEAANGAEALRVAAVHAGPLHLLVTDMVMPQLGGKELAIKMGRRYPQTRVLFVSGYSGDGMSDPSAFLPGAHFLPKPFTVEILAQRVREVLDQPPPTAAPFLSSSVPPLVGSAAPGKDSAS
jgi:two-component system, cell cycle sensor histidine kinase and response regulator CckA